jgi:hypothetical protein
MATLSVIQHNPVIKAFYQRLVAAGKPKKKVVRQAGYGQIVGRLSFRS